jgi:hypothetical protein
LVAVQQRPSSPWSAPWLRQSFLPARLAVAREHPLSRFQFAELASELLVLCIDARERFADPLLLFGDLVQCRHSFTVETEYRLIRIDQTTRRLSLRCAQCNGRVP